MIVVGRVGAGVFFDVGGVGVGIDREVVVIGAQIGAALLDLEFGLVVHGWCWFGLWWRMKMLIGGRLPAFNVCVALARRPRGEHNEGMALPSLIETTASPLWRLGREAEMSLLTGRCRKS